MDDNEFKQFVIEKLIEIEKELAGINERLNAYSKLSKVALAILAAILAKFGIDVSGVLT